MSVLIKGMEMPERCGVCPFSLYPHSPCWENGSVVDWETRPDWCPLVEILPHGRLIDADALYAVMKKERDRIAKDYGDNDEYVQCLTKYAINMVHSAPTIIPAEEVYGQYTDTAGKEGNDER